MILLVVDTSGRQGSVVLARAGELADARKVEMIGVAALTGGTFSAQLVPQIAGLLAQHGFQKKDVGAFVVVSGPGSFTGLRVGLAAIKAMAEILRKPIMPVSLLQVVAVAAEAQGRVVSVLDAGRHEFYAGEYEVSGETAQILRDQVLSLDEFVAMAKGLAVFTSDSTVADRATAAGLSCSLIEPVTMHAIARLGWRKLLAGEFVSPEQLDASYMRRSDAEMFLKSGS
jgi:tRNA threonylcarbamoyladenosine biosynthesis protein TsaB